MNKGTNSTPSAQQPTPLPNAEGMAILSDILRHSDRNIAMEIVTEARRQGYKLGCHGDSDCSYIIVEPGNKQWFLYRNFDQERAGVVKALCEILREDRA